MIDNSNKDESEEFKILSAVKAIDDAGGQVDSAFLESFMFSDDEDASTQANSKVTSTLAEQIVI